MKTILVIGLGNLGSGLIHSLIAQPYRLTLLELVVIIITLPGGLTYRALFP